jgi:hypothetical protein
MTSEEYFSSIVFVRSAKAGTLEADLNIDVEDEFGHQYPSTLLEPQKLQGTVGRGNPQSILQDDWILSRSSSFTEHQWSLSTLYSSQCSNVADTLAERLVNTLEPLPEEQKIRVYLSLLEKLKGKVREHRRATPGSKSTEAKSGGEIASGKGEESFQDKNSEVGAAAERSYQDVSAQLWSEQFKQWAANHRKLSYEVDDSRESIYADRS